MDNQTCGTCIYWDHANKRNCSTLEMPVYYSQCLYPIDDLVLPGCVLCEEMRMDDGTHCPCFKPKAIPLDWRNGHMSLLDRFKPYKGTGYKPGQILPEPDYETSTGRKLYTVQQIRAAYAQGKSEHG